MSNLTKENTGKVFEQGEARKFFSKGGTSILATQNVRQAQAQRSYIANKFLAEGNNAWVGELQYAYANKSFVANKAISADKHLAGGELLSVDHEKALQAVNMSEAQQAALLARSGKEM